LKRDGTVSGVASFWFSPIVYALELHEIHTLEMMRYQGVMLLAYVIELGFNICKGRSK